MSTPTNQTRSTDPHPRSFFAFAMNLVDRLAADEPPPLWLGPVSTDGMDADVATYFDRHNPMLRSMEGALRDNIVADLRALGVPERRLADPNDNEVSAVIDKFLTSQKMALAAVEERARSAPQAHSKIKTNWIVVGGLCSAVARQMPGASKNAVRNRVASILNDGIPTHATGYGVTRDHVLRNETAFQSALLERGRTASIHVGKERALEMTAAYGLHAIEQVEQAKTIYDEARTRPEYVGLYGLDLAGAICAQHDIFACFSRAERVLQRKRAA